MDLTLYIDNKTFNQFFNAVDGRDLPLKVKFVKQIWDDDFVERGMIAYLTDITIEDTDTFKLWFYFDEEDFNHNKKLFKKIYNIHGESKLQLCTHDKAVGGYEEYYSVFADREDKWRDYLEILEC